MASHKVNNGITPSYSVEAKIGVLGSAFVTGEALLVSGGHQRTAVGAL